MSFIQLLLVLYVAGFFLIGIPMGIYSLRVWRRSDKNQVLSFLLFPCHRFAEFVDHGQRYVGVYQNACPWGMLVHMLSEHDILNASCKEDTCAQLKCARYVMATAIVWPLRVAYLSIAAVIAGVVLVLVLVYRAYNLLFDLVDKLLLRCMPRVRF
ncbi:MAG: hypothetical protein A2942_01815 [Candidatus Lloydbacteria bacterium RIFCSPLOWO2_01_FULL_50_20]|uniref:Uncharacterized protein n=1 Tax=Candidatus Lloydbacteria bacterium RIFCSPLOWO2_01_FULL_50_20 TaxID=1798665 RepID=A0A1G2DEC6_9BACT|nr:MAG: hypothetical protein A2942_01815 [Candidatus Lloydbacteria bacterium RIFCSPLOWO2_01_FULL_50_20]